MPKCFHKLPKKYPHPFLIAQKSTIFWATFVSKFVAKNFQKLPNLVTLDDLHLKLPMADRLYFLTELNSVPTLIDQSTFQFATIGHCKKEK